MLKGSPRKLATGCRELPATPELCAQALCTQVGSLQEGGASFCRGADGCCTSPHWLPGPQDPGPWPTAQMGRQRHSGFTQGLKSEITVTAGAIYSALSLLQALGWALWPWDQFLGIDLIIPT